MKPSLDLIFIVKPDIFVLKLKLGVWCYVVNV